MNKSVHYTIPFYLFAIINEFLQFFPGDYYSFEKNKKSYLLKLNSEKFSPESLAFSEKEIQKILTYYKSEFNESTYSHTSKRHLISNMEKELLKEKYIYRLGTGEIAYSSRYKKYLDTFEHLFFSLGKYFCPEYIYYPSSIPEEIYHQSGYLTSFGHKIYSRTLHQNNNALGTNLTSSSQTESGLADSKTASSYCLGHAACLHLYHQLAGTNLKQTANYYMVKSHVFRVENSGLIDMTRLPEFDMLEIVILGTQQSVKLGIEKFFELIKSFIIENDLTAQIAYASDSFMLSSFTAKKLYQLALKTKQEILFPVHKHKEIAVGSVNYLDKSLTTKFNIRIRGKEASSACFAIGLERLTFAFLCQYGLDVEHWPVKIKKLYQSIQKQGFQQN